MTVIDELKSKFRNGDSLIRLMFVNFIVFIFINLYLLIDYFSNGSISAGLGEDLHLAASSSINVMLHRPWSIVTHMFTHVQFGHFIFNMIALYTMGQLFLSIQGSKKLLSLYIMGGLAGYVLFFISYNLFDTLAQNREHYVLGASAAVMAIVVASATLQPKKTLFLFGIVKIELMWLAGILVLLDLASIRQGVNSGGHIGHIGGAIFGYFYARQIQKNIDMGSWLDKLLLSITNLFSKKKMSVASRQTRAKSDEQYNLEKKARQKRIDEILDRIAKSGYDSLSKDEKDFLFRNSQK